jgi:hypothetical protein
VLAAAALLVVAACGDSNSPPPPEQPAFSPSVAFMTDVHFENVYGDFKTTAFTGIPTADGKNATIRTMYAQLTSTRLFNENYFAFRSALDDAHAKGIKFVALPGDYSDDAQPINIDGIAAILKEYQAKGMRFFIAPGNHDPNEPYDDDEAGKNDFLTKDGKEQKVYATGNAACKTADPAVACTDQLKELGYESILARLGEFGFMPNKDDLRWETPFSQYTGGTYTFTEAQVQSDLAKRQFEICLEGEGGAYKAAGEAALGKNLNPFKRKRDKPVAYWSGLKSSSPEWSELVYDVPDHFNGTLRVMAVVVTLIACGLLGWIIRRLMSPAVRQEFA